MKDAFVFFFWIVGCALTLWGAYILLASQSPPDHRTLTNGLILILCGILTIVIILWTGDSVPVTEEAPQ
jgi:hypothetical protein